jgi:hypothetical protein
MKAPPQYFLPLFSDDKENVWFDVKWFPVDYNTRKINNLCTKLYVSLLFNQLVIMKYLQINARHTVLFLFFFAHQLPIFAQPVMETGGQKMPTEWIDKDTKHKVVKLSAGLRGNSLSFYFHNNPFIGNEMIFFNNSNQVAADVTDMRRDSATASTLTTSKFFLLI